MNLDEKPTHYEVLSLTPDASVSQIREAYLRVKSTYNKDSLALYTLIDPSEREEMLRQIEEAYAILSDHEKRKEYDSCHGLLHGRIMEQQKPEDTDPFSGRSGNVVSIDRVPPMSSHSNDDLLVPPSTDFPNTSFGGLEDDSPFGISPPPAPAAALSSGARTYAAAAPAPTAPAPRRTSDPGTIPDELIAALASETDWTGQFLKRVREARKISIEELSHVTKISKTYLFAIEEENFSKLPAPVFVRGFIHQLTRTLKLPSEAVVNAYMSRFIQARK